MSVLLSMYKVVPKDQRDKAALLQIEAKLRAELSEARTELAALQSSNTDLSNRLTLLQNRENRAVSVKREEESQQHAEAMDTDQSATPGSDEKGKDAAPPATTEASPKEGTSTGAGSGKSISLPSPQLKINPLFMDRSFGGISCNRVDQKTKNDTIYLSFIAESVRRKFYRRFLIRKLCCAVCNSFCVLIPFCPPTPPPHYLSDEALLPSMPCRKRSTSGSVTIFLRRRRRWCFWT